MSDKSPTVREKLRLSGWAVVIIAVALVAALTVAALWVFGIGWFQRSTADHRGETAALEEILADPDRRITAYEHFYDLCASIQGHEATIRALEQELDTDPSDSRREQIHGAITANRAQRETKIHRYNSDAAKDYTVGQFRDAGLPDRLDIDAEETTCVAEP
jgi:hypothetical protein